LKSRILACSAAIGTVIAASGAMAPTALADMTGTYVVASSDVQQVCPAQTPGKAVGGSCFTVQPGHIDVTIKDTSGQKVAAYVTFQDANRADVPNSRQYFCGNTISVDVPADAATLLVGVGQVDAERTTNVDNPTGVGIKSLHVYNGKVDCLGANPGTSGTITVSGSGVAAARSASSRASRGTAHYGTSARATTARVGTISLSGTDAGAASLASAVLTGRRVAQL
jgi:hypothetical protein